MVTLTQDKDVPSLQIQQNAEMLEDCTEDQCDLVFGQIVQQIILLPEE